MKLNHNMKLRNMKAFTLIEMLVVISLIGILASLVSVSFSSAQKQARDVTRKSDLKQYQTSLEVFANLASGLYPYRTATDASTTLCNDLNTVIEPNISCSEDPKVATNGAYRYISNGSGALGSSTGTAYVLWAKLENPATTTYYVVCSTGKVGTTTTLPTTSTCPTLN
jgi:prepilin-type N-terminal cleavage/methylation domain-containing protein